MNILYMGSLYISISFTEAICLIRKNKKIILIFSGFLQGTFGSYIALPGIAFAFPETEPGMKDYEEDLYFVPLGYFIMLAWIAFMVFAIYKLRKDRKNLMMFIISWLIGVIGLLILIFIFTH